MSVKDEMDVPFVTVGFVSCGWDSARELDFTGAVKFTHDMINATLFCVSVVRCGGHPIERHEETRLMEFEDE